MSFGFGFHLGFDAHRSGTAVPLPPPDPDPDPTPDPVSLTVGGSLRFPENNNESSVPGFRGFLRQSGPSPWFAGGGSAFAIVRLPRTRRVDNREYGVYGTNHGGGAHFLSYNGETFYNLSLRSRFRFYLSDRASHFINVASAVWDEDSALVVMTWDGTNAYCDWYSLTDGTRHAGTPTAVSEHNGTDAWRAGFLIGGRGDNATQTDIARASGYWSGEIAVVGYCSGATDVSDWQAIAQGADPLTTLGAANLAYYRQLDGTAASLDPPAAATADPDATLTVIDGENLSPGSDFWLGSSGLAIDGPPTRYVYGLLKGEASRDVTFSGRAVTAHEGATVEVQVFNAETGAVEVDWTSTGTIASGAWSGAVTVPRSSQGWVLARARIVGSDPEIVAVMAEPFAVGWKFAIFGQSQMEYGAYFSNRADAATAPFTLSAGIDSGGGPWLEVVKVRDRDLGDAVVALGEQMRQYGDDTPVMACWYTISGTSALDMIDDGLSGRTWEDLLEKSAVWGTDITAVLWNWGTSDLGNGAWSEIFDAVFDGTGPKAADHALVDVFRPGFGRILSPLTRATTTGAGPLDVSDLDAYNDREEQIAYAEANGWTVGPYVYMQVPDDIGGPHQDLTAERGNPLVGNRLAIAVARHLGLDTSTNPHLTGTAVFNEDRTTITVPVTLPNGGTLTAEAPNAITGFEVNDGGAPITGLREDVWTRSGFTAAISGSDIILTKDSGAWSEGTTVSFMFGGPLCYGSSVSETTLLDGVPHESYALDGRGWGLPLDGLGAVEITVA